MDFKDIQDKLQNLRDRIRAEGRISPSSEQELKDILQDTLASANQEITSLQNKLNIQMMNRAENDNLPPRLSDEQTRRLKIMEKTGTGSSVVH